MLWLILTGLVAVFVYYTLIKPHQYWAEKGAKQTKPVILFGDNMGTVLRTEHLNDMILRIYKATPGTRYTGFYQFYIPSLMIKDPELIKQITVKDFDHFTDHKPFVDAKSDPLFGKNLFSLRGHEWRDMRSMLSGSFTSSKMRQIFDLMIDASNNFVEHFLRKDQKVVEVEMKDVFTRFANDVIATTAFGVKVDSLEYQKNDFYVMGKELTNFTGLKKNLKFFGYSFVPSLFKLFGIPFFDSKLSSYFKKIINDTITTREEKGIVRPDMINLLLEARKGNVKQEESSVIDTGFAVVHESPEIVPKTAKSITNDEITSQALIFFFAGFETASTMMCFLAYELAVNQDIQKKLREEIKKVSEECKGVISYEALLKMKYFDMVISETLRKWPGAGSADRICTKPYTIMPVFKEENPIDISVGDVLWIPIFGIHRDPEYYTDPEKFDPERFSDENKDNIRPYTYLPFGAGPRNCIGSRFALLEAKSVFFNILLNFEIVPTKKTQIPVRIDKKTINLTSENGFWFGLQRI